MFSRSAIHSALNTPTNMDATIEAKNPKQFINLVYRMSKENSTLFTKKIQNSCKQFATGTSLHGFTEMYHAKSMISKSCWVLFISVALGFTFFQVYQATDQYVNQSSTTSVEPVMKEDMLYPPLKLCVNHWIQWIDWDKAYRLHYSRQGVLYGFSCNFDVISNNSFSIDQARDEFNKAQRLNNVSTVEAFLKLVTRSIDDFVLDVYSKAETNINFVSASQIFTDVRLDMHQKLCYIAPSDKLKLFIEPLENETSKINFLGIRLDEAALSTGPQKFLSIHEYAWYMARWLSFSSLKIMYELKDSTSNDGNNNEQLNVANYAGISVPLSLYINGYRHMPITLLSAEVDTYRVLVKASVNRWMSTDQRSCSNDSPYIYPNDTCFEVCIKEKSREIYGRNKRQDVCISSIRFLTGNVADADQSSQTTITNGSTTDKDVLDKMFNEERLKCKKKCAGEVGCEIWRYDVVVASSSMYSSLQKLAYKRTTSLIIHYPSDGETLVVTEIAKQSWENFVGSIGGIVGVWTGASILSFIQTFYLCCCTQLSSSDY